MEVTRIPVLHGEMVIKFIVITWNLPNWDDRDSQILFNILVNLTILVYISLYMVIIVNCNPKNVRKIAMK